MLQTSLPSNLLASKETMGYYSRALAIISISLLYSHSQDNLNRWQAIYDRTHWRKNCEMAAMLSFHFPALTKNGVRWKTKNHQMWQSAACSSQLVKDDRNIHAYSYDWV
jgi:hypothetical protein